MPRLVLAVALIIGLCCGALAQSLVESATYSLKTSSIISGGGAPSVDLTASQTIGFFKFVFTEPLYFKLDGQCLPNVTCFSQTVQDCCYECTDNNGLKVPYPLNPLNPPNCYCAQSVQSVCIDLKGTYSQYSDAARLLNGYSSSAHHAGAGNAGGGGFNTPKKLARDEIHNYEFNTFAPCANLLLTVITLDGDQNLYVNTETYPTPIAGAVGATDPGNQHHHHTDSDPFAGVVSNSTTQTAITANISASSIAPGYDWYSNAWSTRRMSDSVVFCSTNSVPYTMPNGMDPATYKLNMVNDFGVFTSTYFITVHGYLPGDYTIRLEQAAPAQPQFLLSTVEYYHLAPALRHLHCGPSQFAVYGLPPSDDPGFSYFAIQSGEQPLNVTTMNTTLHDDVFAFALDVSLTINGVTTVLFSDDLSTCALNFSHGRVWYDANGVNVANTVQPFLLEAPTCDFADLSLAYEGLLEMIDNVSNARTLDQISQGIMGGAMWSTSDAWLGCEAFVKSKLMLRFPVSNTVASTTRCYAQPGTTDYANDPCCNGTLLFSECCVPRTIPITTERLIPLEDYINSECRTDSCSMQAATEFAQVSNSLSDSRIGCDAVADSVSQDPGFRDTQIAECFGRYTAACTTNANCPSDTSCDTSRGVCRYPSTDQVISSCTISLLSPELKIPLNVLLNISADSTDTVLANTLYSRYLVTGCDQPLLKLTQTTTRDYTADTNNTICQLGGQFCNWDNDPTLNRPNASCVGTPWRGDHYCYSPAQCSDVVPSSCPEISKFQGCFTNLTLQSECELNGGIYDINERGNVYVCWLNGTATQGACVSATLCEASTTKICQPFCYDAALTQPTCDCSLYPNPGDAYYTICNQTNTALAWDSAKGTGVCVISSAVYNGTSAGCAALGATSWYLGGFWQAASLSDQASCNNSGLCTAEGVNDQVTCSTATACTVKCVGCNATQCQQTGACSDTMIPSVGTCVVAPIPNTFGTPSCPSVAGASFTIYPIGCVDSNNVLNASACAARNDGSAWTLPAANDTECTSVMRCRELRNGAFIHTRKNATTCALCGGTYTSIFSWDLGQASAAVWQANVWGPRARISANTPGASLWNFTAAQASISNVFLARYAQLAKTFLACQYGGVASYLSLLSCDCSSDLSRCYNQFQPVLLGVTRICSSANTTNLLAPAELHSTPQTVFASGCANLQVSLIPAGRFRRGSSNIYSSLFLDSIQTNEFAVIENKNQVVVGQLIGNGVQFQMGTTANPGLELCIEIRPDIEVAGFYDTYDFAVLSDDFKDFSIFYSTGITVRPNSAGVQSVCSLVTDSGNYFPIKRIANSKNAKFSDTLSSKQKAAFWAGMAIYIVCWICATYRLASLFLWTLIRPADASGQVKTAHPLLVPRIAMALLFFFFFLRWLYFILVPAGVMLRAPLIIDILMAELPTYFFITIFSLLVLWWVELYHRSSARKSFLGRMKWVFIGVNAVLYIFLMVVIIIYAVEESKNHVGVCSTSSRSTKTADIVAKVYKVFVSVVALILALGFMLYGLRLFLMVVGVSGSLDRIVKFVLISTVCSIGLLLQCALLLYSTFKPSSRKTDTALAIAFTLVVEVLPGLVLIAFMRQPELHGLTWYQDLVWCAYADRDISISGAGASKSFQSSKRSATSGASVQSGGASAGSGSGGASGGASGSASDLAVGPSQSAHSRY